jgi:hypothetical protein
MIKTELNWYTLEEKLPEPGMIVLVVWNDVSYLSTGVIEKEIPYWNTTLPKSHALKPVDFLKLRKRKNAVSLDDVKLWAELPKDRL